MKTDAKSVLDFENPKMNDHGALYEPGRPFGRLKWFEVLEHYYAMLETHAEEAVFAIGKTGYFNHPKKLLTFADVSGFFQFLSHFAVNTLSK